MKKVKHEIPETLFGFCVGRLTVLGLVLFCTGENMIVFFFLLIFCCVLHV